MYRFIEIMYLEIDLHTATHCNTPQHTATHRNTPQHTATHYNTPQHTATLYIEIMYLEIEREHTWDLYKYSCVRAMYCISRTATL